MNVEHDIEELVARYAEVVVCCYHFARTWKDWVAIIARIQAVSEEADRSEVSFESIRPLLQVELSDRFDQETAELLLREFTDMFAIISSFSPVIVGHR